MRKYDPLREHLATAAHPVEMTFEQIGRLVGGLPPSAYRRQEWWSNNPDRHVQAAAWLESRRLVESVDLRGQRVIFT